MATEPHRLQDVLQSLHEPSHQPIRFHRLIGMEQPDEQAYAEAIYTFIDALKEQQRPHAVLKEGLASQIPVALTQQMHLYWKTVSKLKEPTSDVIVNITFGYRHAPFINDTLHALVSQALVKTLNLFRETQQNLEVIKNFFCFLVYWVEECIPTLLSNDSEAIQQAVVVYYGDIKRNEAYFLYFLSALGVQTVYLNPNGADGTQKVQRITSLSTLYEWREKKAIPVLPARSTRTATVARKAQQEIQEILHTDTNGIYKPWQFEEYNTQTIPLQTTLDELFILWKEPAKFRTGFAVQNQTVHIPTIFAKISGVQEDIEQYWENYHALQQATHQVTFTQCPIAPNVTYHNQMIVVKNGQFDEADVKNMKEYDFHHLRASVQKNIIQAINALIQDENMFCNIPKKRDFPYMVLHTVLQLDASIVSLMQTFDYADQIPKMIVFDTKKTAFTFHDAILLGFLHKMGFDVVIFTPTGYQNMERFIDPRFFDHHKQENYVFDLSIKQYEEKQQKPWFYKWFKK